MDAQIIERLIELADTDDRTQMRQAAELASSLDVEGSALRDALRAREVAWMQKLLRTRNVVRQQRVVSWLILRGEPYSEDIIDAVTKSIDARMSASRRSMQDLALDMMLRLAHPPHLQHHLQSFLDGDRICRRSWLVSYFHSTQYINVLHTLICVQPPVHLSSIRHLDYEAIFSPNASVQTVPSLEVCRALPGLESLALDACNIYRLPEYLGELRALRRLRLRRATLPALPASLAGLPHLEELDLSDGAFHSLPQGICELRSLARLTLAGCKGLKSLPPELADLPALQMIDVTDCRSLAGLPDALVQRPDIQILGQKERGARPRARAQAGAAPAVAGPAGP